MLTWALTMGYIVECSRGSVLITNDSTTDVAVLCSMNIKVMVTKCRTLFLVMMSGSVH